MEQVAQAVVIAVVVIGSIGFSFALACATPFAALVSTAALNVSRRDLITLIGAAWLANQIIGYGSWRTR
jgi:hypothetical protein